MFCDVGLWFMWFGYLAIQSKIWKVWDFWVIGVWIIGYYTIWVFVLSLFCELCIERLCLNFLDTAGNGNFEFSTMNIPDTARNGNFEFSFCCSLTSCFPFRDSFLYQIGALGFVKFGRAFLVMAKIRYCMFRALNWKSSKLRNSFLRGWNKFVKFLKVSGSYKSSLHGGDCQNTEMLALSFSFEAFELNAKSCWEWISLC